jgi:hypothetical protein
MNSALDRAPLSQTSANKVGQNPNRYQDIVSARIDRTMVAVVDLGGSNRRDEDVVWMIDE